MLSLIRPVAAYASMISTMDYIRIRPNHDTKTLTADGFCNQQRVWLHVEMPYTEDFTHPVYLHRFGFFTKLATHPDFDPDNVIMTTDVGKGSDGTELIKKLNIQVGKTKFSYQCVDPTIINFRCPKATKTSWEVVADINPSDVEAYNRVIALHNSMSVGREGKDLVPAVQLSVQANQLKAMVENFGSVTNTTITETVSGEMTEPLDVAVTEFALMMDIIRRNAIPAVLNMNAAQIQLALESDGMKFFINTRKVQTKRNSYG